MMATAAVAVVKVVAAPIMRRVVKVAEAQTISNQLAHQPKW